MLKWISTARLAQSMCSRSRLILVRGIFPIKLFWLRKLAKNVCPRSGPNLGRGIFPVNFRIRCVFWCSLENLDVWIAQARAKYMSAFWAQSGPQHFSCKFPYAMVFLIHLVSFVICWSTFRLRRLAQSMCPRSGLNLGRGIFPVGLLMFLGKC